MKQYDIILKAMLNNRNKKEWKASDFQKEPYFVGYEASPRMSELAKMYPDLLIVGRDGRYRTLSINWDYENIQEYISKYIYNNYTMYVDDMTVISDGLSAELLYEKYRDIAKHIPRID